MEFEAFDFMQRDEYNIDHSAWTTDNSVSVIQ